MTSSWFFLSTLNYDARSTTHQIYEKLVQSYCTFEVIYKLKRNLLSGLSDYFDIFFCHLQNLLLQIAASNHSRRPALWNPASSPSPERYMTANHCTSFIYEIAHIFNRHCQISYGIVATSKRTSQNFDVLLTVHFSIFI